MASSGGGVGSSPGERSPGALDQHLRSAVKEPRFVKTENGGSILALALHCLMVENGFVVEAQKRHGNSPYVPAVEWNGKFTNEWIFDYTRRGFVSVFTLHCSLQAATGKMFVHAREKDNPSNMRYMGLLVGKYVPDLEAAKLDTWTGVVTEQEALKHQLIEFIAEPLLEVAVPSQEREPSEGQSLLAHWMAKASTQLDTMYNRLSRRDVAVGLAAMGLATAAIFWVAARKPARPSH